MNTGTADIVRRVGGADFLADRFNLSRKAIEMWERRGGIPGRWHIPILLLAGERGVSVSLEDLAATNRSTLDSCEEARA